MKKVVMMGIGVSLWLLLTMRSVAEPLQVVTLEQPPLEYEEQGAIKGIAVDLVKEVFARMPQPITLQLYPFARSLEMLKAGEADAIFAIVKKPERELFADFPSEVLIEQTATLFVRKEAPIRFDGDFRKLSAYRFGILRGATYGPQWDEAVNTGIISKIEAVTDYRQNVTKLVNNRLDIMIGPRLSMLYIIKELGQQDAVKELSPAIESVPTYLAFSKTRVTPEIKAQFEHILKELKRDGTYDKIIQAYIH
jgi:polar amino acid transport system substrate-binding protein